jgi:oligopeptidase B
VAEAPFVDVVTTMSDASIPLTTLEYDEWGNPAVKREYDYMLSYSPYDNVARKNYPAMFVTTGFYDSQVSYAEPAKWVARLRASKTDTHDLLFKTDMDAQKSWAGSSRIYGDRAIGQAPSVWSKFQLLDETIPVDP